MTETRALLDTSVFIALESGRTLDSTLLPDIGYVSAITVGELHAGVYAAKGTRTKAARLATVEALASVEILPVSADAARHWARLRYELVEAGRRINVNDLWIASTALAHDLPVATQDDDYAVLAGLGGPDVIRL